MRKITGFVGSPRKEGNTNTLVRTVLEGAEANGFATEVVYIEDYLTRGCRSDGGCRDQSGCVQQDFSELRNYVDQSDGIVIATPIYIGNISSATQGFLERFFMFTHPRLGKKLPTLLVYTHSQQKDDTYGAILEHRAGHLAMCGLDVFEMMGVGSCSPMFLEVDKNTEALGRAYSLGQRFLQNHK